MSLVNFLCGDADHFISWNDHRDLNRDLWTEIHYYCQYGRRVLEHHWGSKYAEDFFCPLVINSIRSSRPF
jgi:hypothetical protein